MKRVAVLTSGGDAPGMNAAIRAVVRTAIYEGMEVYGVYQGFEGLMAGSFEKLSPGSVADIIHRGGTILHTSRSREFLLSEGQRRAREQLAQLEIDNLVIIGGNGSLRGGYQLIDEGVQVIGIPATIDNDVVYTRSIGYDTAVNTVLSAINNIRDTATSHGRVFIIEVMGRHCGEIALAAGVGGGAESILIPEIQPDKKQVIEKIRSGMERGKLHSIIIVAEGVYPVMTLKDEIIAATGRDTRVSILGHIQRGGTPTAMDRILASYMGKAAIDAILRGKANSMVAGHDDRIYTIPLGEVIKGHKTPDLGMFEIARVLST
ncbi:MAG: 6-phosphofructokinase [Syntrophomonadaceae bacterium]